MKHSPSNLVAAGAAVVAPDTTSLRRGDLGARVAAARAALRSQANHTRGIQAVAAAFAAVALAVVVWYVCEAAGFSAWIAIGAALTITTSFSIGLVQFMVRTTKRIVQQYQVLCPHCGHAMLAVADLAGQLTAVDLTVETGRCAHCGEVSFAA